MRRSLRRTFFCPERPTLTSLSLQSITRPFQKRFREVFGNARILIFYLSIKAWEENSLPKSHLGCFFLVFGEGKATKQNISIFWFIWPLRRVLCKMRLIFPRQEPCPRIIGLIVIYRGRGNVFWQCVSDVNSFHREYRLNTPTFLWDYSHIVPLNQIEVTSETWTSIVYNWVVSGVSGAM